MTEDAAAGSAQGTGTEDGRSGPPPAGRFLIVGVGASAGGLEALDAFFRNLPPDTGMAFVIVTHNVPGRPSLLPELLARHCAMPIVAVSGSAALAPNHVYVAPDGEQLTLAGETLHADVTRDGVRRQYIDVFFRSLAQHARDRAIAIVLSGTGSDGTLGIKEIKAQAGMTMAQEETNARYASMPLSAIASLKVDYILKAEDMPRQLLAYARSAVHNLEAASQQAANTAEHFARIFVILRARTGHDFSKYKSTTIRRRIERRMNVHHVDSLKDYLDFLEHHPSEVDRLFKELLIGVTSFFRDSEAHVALATNIIPQLVRNRPEGHTFRAWVAGCSTGEEAYSLAITFKEVLEKFNRQHAVQIFATDLDSDAIEIARLGEYPESIAADVSAERLERFFQRENEGYYRIRKEVREMLVFAPHSLVEDPPFTKLDLLSCRNLLIYLEARLQQQLMPVFHYSLRPGGVLFLGSSETLGGFAHLFEPLDKRWKIYVKRDVPSGNYLKDIPLPTSEAPSRDDLTAAGPQRGGEAGVGHMAERALLHHLVPPAVIMHERGDVVHIHGRTGQFLEPSPGAQTAANVYNMVREGLQLDLAVAVRHAAASDQAVVHRAVRVKTNGQTISVDLRVKRLNYPEHLKGLFLVAFERAEPYTPDEPRHATDGISQQELADRMGELERELAHSKGVHQSTIEELETANEELKSTNEELQSTNEELQSANEELETSKEEMQSLNEELQTVNAELQGKVEELSRANDDMKNLLNGTDIATIFLDRDLNIKRYTDQARKVIRLIPSDVGRSVGDLVSKLKYKALAEDAQDVLQTLVFKEAEVQSEDGSWYLMRMLPYRTTENVIDGLVVTFVDTTKLKGLQEEARRLVSVLASSPIGIFGQNAQLVYEWAFGSVAGHRAEHLVGRGDEEIFGGHAQHLIELKREVVASGKPLRRRIKLGHDGAAREHDLYLQPILGRNDAVVGVNGVVTALEDTARVADVRPSASP